MGAGRCSSPFPQPDGDGRRPDRTDPGDLFNWPGIIGAILLPSIPLALLYNAFLNRFIVGVTGGAFR